MSQEYVEPVSPLFTDIVKVGKNYTSFFTESEDETHQLWASKIVERSTELGLADVFPIYTVAVQIDNYLGFSTTSGTIMNKCNLPIRDFLYMILVVGEEDLEDRLSQEVFNKALDFSVETKVVRIQEEVV